MQFHKLTGNGQTQTQSASLQRIGFVNLLIITEDALQLFPGNAPAGIGDRYRYGIIQLNGLNNHAAAIGEFQRIVHQVVEDLHQPLLIRLDQERPWRNAVLDADLAVLIQKLEDFNYNFCNALNINSTPVQGDALPLDLFIIKDIPDQEGQPSSGSEDQPHILTL